MGEAGFEPALNSQINSLTHSQIPNMKILTKMCLAPQAHEFPGTRILNVYPFMHFTCSSRRRERQRVNSRQDRGEARDNQRPDLKRKEDVGGTVQMKTPGEPSEDRAGRRWGWQCRLGRPDAAPVTCDSVTCHPKLSDSKQQQLFEYLSWFLRVRNSGWIPQGVLARGLSHDDCSSWGWPPPVSLCCVHVAWAGWGFLTTWQPQDNGTAEAGLGLQYK